MADAGTPPAPLVTAVLTKAKETKNTWQYKETVPPGGKAALGTIYLPKSLGDLPESVEVKVLPR